jgi:hypothetical protein
VWRTLVNLKKRRRKERGRNGFMAAQREPPSSRIKYSCGTIYRNGAYYTGMKKSWCRLLKV